MESEEPTLSLFRCPLCAAPLARGETTYLCPRGHSYDRSRDGYVHLLPANQMHSKCPGDDKCMAAARNRFLSKDYYGPLRDALCTLVLKHTADAPAVLDAGCGEGYYTAGVYEALRSAGKTPQMAGVDISKFALRWAARRTQGVEFGVASAYRLPVGDHTVDLLMNCFAPLALEETGRVLRSGGIFLYVVPAADHLWALKQVLYDTPYRNPEEATPYAGFRYLEILPVEAQIRIESREDVADLFQMTPYYWKTSKEGAARLSALDGLAVRASFRIHVFQREK